MQRKTQTRKEGKRCIYLALLQWRKVLFPRSRMSELNFLIAAAFPFLAAYLPIAAHVLAEKAM